MNLIPLPETPKHGNPVACVIHWEVGHVGPCWVTGYLGEDGQWYDSYGDHKLENVSHWMELPDISHLSTPYEQEE